jgi:hypothetical protein
MRNHVASHGKADLGKLMRIGSNDRGGCGLVAGMKAGQQERSYGGYGKQVASQAAMPAQT